MSIAPLEQVAEMAAREYHYELTRRGRRPSWEDLDDASRERMVEAMSELIARGVVYPGPWCATHEDG